MLCIPAPLLPANIQMQHNKAEQTLTVSDTSCTFFQKERSLNKEDLTAVVKFLLSYCITIGAAPWAEPQHYGFHQRVCNSLKLLFMLQQLCCYIFSEVSYATRKQ